MLLTFAIGLVTAGLATAQSATPTASAPPGCSTDYNGQFELTVVLPNTKRAVVEDRDACGPDGTLVVSLAGGVLTDAKGRIGEIVANRQFQFDGPPPQAGTVYSGGWSVCPGNLLAIGSSTVFFQCLSGTFYNLYDQKVGGQCQEVRLYMMACGSSAAASEDDSGDVQASSAVPQPVSQYTDGQIQVTAQPTARPAAQIGDGQIQNSVTPQSIAIPTAKPVSQISDGQVQNTAKPQSAPSPTGQPVSQISDGQIQASAPSASSPANTIVPPPLNPPTYPAGNSSTLTTAKAATGSVTVLTSSTVNPTTSPLASTAAAGSATGKPNGAASPAAAAAHIVAAAIAIAAAAILI